MAKTRKRRRKRMSVDERRDMEREALRRAASNQSLANYPAIFEGFMEKGIPEAEIVPRVNVFSYHAWRALGRQVRKGEKGVKVVTYIDCEKKTDPDDKDSSKVPVRRCTSCTVFHVSQTDAIEGAEPADIPKPETLDDLLPSTPATVPPAKPKGNAALAARFREMADKLEPKIADKFADRLTNTPKRQKQAASARLDGEKMQRVQRALRALADAHDSDSVPDELQGIKTKAAIEPLVSTKLEYVSNGYHGYHVCTGKYSNDSAEAKVLHVLMGDAKSREELLEAEIRRKEDALRFSKIDGFFPTPADTVELMLEELGIEDGHRVLEPSAGKGDIVQAIVDAHDDVTIQCVELHWDLVDILEWKFTAASADVGNNHVSVLRGDFLELPLETYDRIGMNPPFERGADVKHIQHAFELLKPGGRLVALCSGGSSLDKLVPWADSLGGFVQRLDAGSFKGKEAFRQTGVNVCMLVVERENVEPWTEDTPLTQVDAEMRAAITGEPMPQDEFSGKTIGEATPDELAGCNCPMVGAVTNVDCPIHGTKQAEPKPEIVDDAPKTSSQLSLF